MPVYSIYVEKRPEFAVEAAGVLSEITSTLRISGIKSLRLLNRYFVENIEELDFKAAIPTIFSEPQVDDVYFNLDFVKNEKAFAIEYLPGQFDQRANSCAECIQLATQKEQPIVTNARVYVIDGDISDKDLERIKAYLINPVESREATLTTPQTLTIEYEIPTEVETLKSFISLDKNSLADFIKQYGLAMDIDDIRFCQEYFKSTEKRSPTITEIRMIDTYWSDHCRHTTFSTNIDEVSIECDYINDTYNEYLELREKLHKGKNKPLTLMDIATIGAKALKTNGKLADLDESEEINACSVKITVDHDGKDEQWLLMFKNETHNHPTEIEPFGGAATCLGGSIRDPLSGRSYVYHAMRVTGSGNPFTSLEDTRKGKLTQKKITTSAAAGYSSYGNQIGLATGQVSEIYHDGYTAKRMEVGAVVGAVPADYVVREVPEAGDVVILLGGKTGRDGCGGATGSSKSHDISSLETCGAEVQKGNAPEERKIQRLFRNPEVTKLIRRCNDFGAGGVSVAIGELADGLIINLDAVPKKYAGLDGTELAISESQERMAVVIRANDLDKFKALSAKENLSATKVADVTAENRLVMNWNGKKIVDLDRNFLNSNGAVKHTTISVEAPLSIEPQASTDNTMKRFEALVEDLNICSQKGLSERFDSTIAAGTINMPFGGKEQLTPIQSMVAKIPVLTGDTTTCSVMAYGFNPYISEKSPYHGAMLAVLESVSKVVAAGGSYKKCWLSFQEYFEKLQNNPTRWGKPFSALLGALKAQLELEIGAIGGKDSMSGSFEDIDVPPTLISFAVSVGNSEKIVSPEFKSNSSYVYLFTPDYNENGTPCFTSVKAIFDKVEALISSGKASAVWTLQNGGVAEGLFKMCLGNKIGFKFAHSVGDELLFNHCYGGFIVESKAKLANEPLFGITTKAYEISMGHKSLNLDDLQHKWEMKLNTIFPYILPTPKMEIPTYSYERTATIKPKSSFAKPHVLIPVFPGTNCEYDTARAFEREGADPEIFIVRNLSPNDIESSVREFMRAIEKSQIIAIPGGFSGGDEPDGSAKFITSFFRNPAIKDAVHDLIKNRDGLMLGICNGFQALVKLGLVPYGEITEPSANSPTLTFNRIGRHQSGLIRTRVASNKSPWLMYTNVGDIHILPVSHGEGRFVADDALIAELAQNGQIPTQYVDMAGNPTMETRFNPNFSTNAIESLTSPDGRILGKMLHSERVSKNTYKNIPGEKYQPILKGAVDYYKI